MISSGPDLSSSCVVSVQQEAADCDPLDELYDALAEVLGAEDTTECYKSYLLVSDLNVHRITARLLMVSMKIYLFWFSESEQQSVSVPGGINSCCKHLRRCLFVTLMLFSTETTCI